jgi:hypothetical protein
MRLRLTPSAAFASAASSGVESVEAMHIQYERYSVFDGGRAPFRWPASQSNDRPRLPPDSHGIRATPGLDGLETARVLRPQGRKHGRHAVVVTQLTHTLMDPVGCPPQGFL